MSAAAHVLAGEEEETETHTAVYTAALLAALSDGLAPDLTRLSDRHAQIRAHAAELDQCLADRLEDTQRWQMHYGLVAEQLQALPHVPSWIHTVQERVASARREALHVAELLEQRIAPSAAHRPM